MKNDEILNGKVGILLFKLSFPAAAGMIACSALDLIDTFFISKLGSEALAALTISLPIQNLIISIVSATGTGITSGIARALGSNRVEHADNIAWHGIFISLIYGIIFGLLVNRYIDDILVILGTPVQTFYLVREYMLIILWACVFSFIPMTIGNIIQGEGDTLWSIIITLIAMGINVLLDPFFIFGLKGINGMGLNGAAVAAVLSQAVSCILVIILMKRRRKRFLTWSFRHFHPSIKVLLNIYKVGLPAIIMEISGVITMTCFTRLLGGYSSTAVAASGVFLRIRALVFMPVYGLAQGSMPIASFAYGAGNLPRVRETIMKASFYVLFYMILCWFLLQFYPNPLMRLFADDPSLFILGVTCVKLGTIFIPAVGVFLILVTIMQAVGKGTMAMSLYLTKQICLMLPLLLMLPHFYGLNGVWLVFSVADIISAFLAAIFFLKLWRELQEGRKTGIIVFLRWNYILKRFWAWIKN
ncbi:MATE family efflux transporter [Thermosyntropha sp.]|uniref:MATE family efflux transporter n=1 Tax=Thermosyntropha sp. TaxID=2740820 RepID=UPI0025E6E037|nr:MATE family efflux transporter [Thermosyntropha sp.]MBO8158694.1 MATE family efflux transporter [Thermosyntropha sp.]